MDAPLTRETPKKNDGRIVLFLAALTLGGAVFMLGKLWYSNYRESAGTEEVASELTDFRFISPVNILDRIRKNENIRFIDIRERASFEATHLIDSQWLSPSERLQYTQPAGELTIVVFDENTSNDELKALHEQYTEKKMTFAFLEGGIKNWITQGGTVISIADPTSYVDQTKVTIIEPEAVEGLQKTLVRTILLDVRPAPDYQKEHLPGAINVPIALLEKNRQSIPAIGSLIVYGADQTEGFQAGTRLFDMGFFGLRIINGGFKAWKEKNLPTATGSQ